MENMGMMVSRESQLTRKGCSVVFCQLEYLKESNLLHMNG